MRALMDSLPPMRPLVMVLKVFLQQRELNEASACAVQYRAHIAVHSSAMQCNAEQSRAVQSSAIQEECTAEGLHASMG